MCTSCHIVKHRYIYTYVYLLLVITFTHIYIIIYTVYIYIYMYMFICLYVRISVYIYIHIHRTCTVVHVISYEIYLDPIIIHVDPTISILLVHYYYYIQHRSKCSICFVPCARDPSNIFEASAPISTR